MEDDRTTTIDAPSPPSAATLPARTVFAAEDPGRSSAVLDGACAPGEVLSRKFRVDSVIGTGGMGVVVAAHHLALDKRVAIKLMRPELRARQDLVRRFLREARAAARLSSRHVTRVFDVGTLEDGAPYIVMEYLDGADLAVWLRQRTTATASLAAAIVLQASDAIIEAHAAGITHRDLKPANLFVTQDRDGATMVKVLDLGICKLDEPLDDLGDTSVATALGTPVYMAPEQLATPPRADARSDIWSLGVILYELVTGRVPFHGHTIAELRARATCDPCPAIQRADVVCGFEAIVARCLAKDPAARFQRVTELAAALAPFASNERSATALTFSTDRRPKRPRWQRRPRVVAVAALAVSGALALGLGERPWFESVSGHPSTTSQAAAPSESPQLPPRPPDPVLTAAMHPQSTPPPSTPAAVHPGEVSRPLVHGAVPARPPDAAVRLRATAVQPPHAPRSSARAAVRAVPPGIAPQPPAPARTAVPPSSTPLNGLPARSHDDEDDLHPPAVAPAATAIDPLATPD